MTARPFPHRHLLGIADLSAEDLTQLLDLGDSFLEISERAIKKVPTLRGRTVINLFLEPSTRTRTSFEIAAKRLSADAVNISGQASSTVKGETLLDTARNLEAMRPDVIVIRHNASGAAVPHDDPLDSRIRAHLGAEAAGGGLQRARDRAHATLRKPPRTQPVAVTDVAHLVVDHDIGGPR